MTKPNRPNEDQLRRYLELKAEASRIDREIRELKTEIQAAGDFETESFEVRVTQYERESLKTAGVIEKYGRVALRKYLSKTEITQLKIKPKQGA